MKRTITLLALLAATVLPLAGCHVKHCPTNASVYYTAGC